ncbi:Glucose dehydrogenase, putative [Penicillium digitatum]|uniref:glucose oxidase n=3 Tax=Penicillium digitatum TaxID=36651 RepID=K9FWP7_PEND2|nr:Glucose dehydrogenase, putative [Penicillium digitatum Pd1]EKV11935.1 Glucose dehydrogenase, putative [Penicillium digitatum Pd1]EKV14080.1 Glucose dehydrogenase, putative [Penicillium digitatum PHI26]QQK43025.1 Glucose dehydrogenase, putative [Penicillium digitatum]
MRPGLSVTQIVGASLVATQFASALLPRTKINDAYDFVIVGGGQAGLVLGARLSENKNHTVLVLESGGNGDEFRKRIDTPAFSYFDSLWTTPLNWDFYTVAQPNADGREINWPRGKVLGGSSAINGLYMTRPGQEEINAWKDMLGDMYGADNWSWDSFYAAMKKSETFTPPTDQDLIEEAGLVWNASSHGTDGPIHTTFPDFTFPEVGNWLKALQSTGIPTSANMYGGENLGADVSTSCINPSNWTRSYSRSGYLDPLADRGNYDVLANAHVTRLVFDNSTSSGKKTASAVEYTTDGGSTKLNVKVIKEVILAGGTIGSPAVLLYSGIGPKDVLSKAGVDLISELPGVGQHLQDHFSATVKWSSNVDTAGSIFYINGNDKNNTKFLTYIDSAVAYVNSTAMYGSQVNEYDSKFLASIDQYAPNTTYDDGVITGYKAICNTTSKIFNGSTGQIELLFMNSDANGDIGITAALQHPFSHGRIYINSSNPMDFPVIDPNYLDNPADSEILLAGIKLARQIGETSPMSKSLTNETSPGLSVQSDDDWVAWLRKEASTEFHPSSSCAMLPEKQGGVVDANLLVYGLANVRVADASVIPIALSTHLMSSTYGVAEQASKIIREFYNPPSKPEPAFGKSTPTSSSTATTAKKSGTLKTSPTGNGGPALLPVWTSLALVAAHVIASYGLYI